MAKHDVTKTLFSQKLLDGFSLDFDGRRRVDVEEDTEGLATYILPFLSYQANSAGGRICPPAGRRLTQRHQGT